MIDLFLAGLKAPDSEWGMSQKTLKVHIQASEKNEYKAVLLSYHLVKNPPHPGGPDPLHDLNPHYSIRFWTFPGSSQFRTEWLVSVSIELRPMLHLNKGI